MVILLYILFAATFFLLLFNLLIYGALNKLFRFEKIEKSDLKISVVVAAKNEAKNISNLISKLVKQDYPQENFEVIIVDDNSTDETFNIAKEKTESLTNFTVTKATEKLFEGKRGALDVGIKKASNPNILITDADCEPREKWISAFADKFEKGYDFVFGIAPYKATNSVTNLITRFENLRANIIVFAFSKLGLPYSAAARSFGFSKNAFNKIEGYTNTTETLSGDDDLLLREAIKHKFKIGMVTNADAFVFTSTKENYTDFVGQKSRHTSTSIHYSVKNQLLLGIWHLLNLLSLFSIFPLPFGVQFALPFFIKIMIDIFILNNFQNNFGYKINPLLFLILQINYEFSLIYFFIKSLSYSKKWS